MPRLQQGKGEVMTDQALVDRLAAVRQLQGTPRAELEWLAAHGAITRYECGQLLRKGEPVENLWIALAGRFSIHVDQGLGPRKVLTVNEGDLAGLMPFSRLARMPGDAIVEIPTEVLAIGRKDFPGLVRDCPHVLEVTVHVMLDRARLFVSSDMQGEKLMSLGRLSAGLAHELNNPSSATVRSAAHLLESMPRSDVASRALGGAGLTPEQVAFIDGVRDTCMTGTGTARLTPLQLADREDDFTDWAEAHGADREVGFSLAQTPVTRAQLDALAGALPPSALVLTLSWIAEGCSTRRLALDIQMAANRIHELVGAMKRYTYMDRASALEPVDVGRSLADTVTILGAKARQTNARFTLRVPESLPRVMGHGGELNQVWMNLLDNALDAVAPPDLGAVRTPTLGGLSQSNIQVEASTEGGWVVVQVMDSGPGIPESIRAKIFDPFFTTKPVGKGTGLGLELVRRVVQRHSGEVDVTSAPGRTVFRVALPAQAGDATGT